MSVGLEVAKLEEHRASLTGHCYRMLGSVVDADDAVQETMVRAWRKRDTFEGRSALTTWLYRIATNVCLDAIAARKRRTRPADDAPPGRVDGELVACPSGHWIEPVPDAAVVPSAARPDEALMAQQSVRLAFVAALQSLPPRQRAVLLLMEILEHTAAETASILETTVAAVNSALQRARATLAARPSVDSAALSATQHELVERYVDAFERFDVDGLTALLRDDVEFSMPPYTLWLQGRQAVAEWLRSRGAICRDSRLVPTRANGAPAFGHYHRVGDGRYTPWGLVAIELEGASIAAWTTFLDHETLFPRFGLPLSIS